MQHASGSARQWHAPPRRIGEQRNSRQPLAAHVVAVEQVAKELGQVEKGQGAKEELLVNVLAQQRVARLPRLRMD